MATSPAVAPSAIESQTVRKVRARIIPFVFILFVISFIDRINIGFAALTMNKALAITSQQFGLLSGVFFLGLFSFRDTKQPFAAQDWRPHLDCEDTGQLGNCGNADGLGDNASPSLYFAFSAGSG